MAGFALTPEAPDALFYGESFPVVILPPRSASLSGAEAGKERQSNRGLGLELKASFYVLRSLEPVQDCHYLVGRGGAAAGICGSKKIARALKVSPSKLIEPIR